MKIRELEKLVDTHDLLPDGSIVRKDVGEKCICMDCGAILWITEQSIHDHKCEQVKKAIEEGRKLVK